MADQDTTTTATTGTDNATGAEGQNGGTGTQGAQQDTERKFTQADLDRAISTRLERERKAAEERTAKERQAAEMDKLKAQAEWEEIAKTHEQSVHELEPIKARYDTLAERIGKQIDAGIKDWPIEARRMVPATDDVAARLDAYENMRGLLEKGTLAPRTPGNAPGPRPQAGPNAREEIAAATTRNPRYNAI